MSWKVFTYEEVSGYSSVLSIKQNAFLKTHETKTLFSSKSAAFFYIAYKLTIMLVIGLAILYSMHLTAILFIAVIMTLFISVIDRELYNLAMRKIALEPKDALLHKFASETLNGWYDDPYANGIVNQQREWINGKWTKNIRTFSAKKL